MYIYHVISIVVQINKIQYMYTEWTGLKVQVYRTTL